MGALHVRFLLFTFLLPHCTAGFAPTSTYSPRAALYALPTDVVEQLPAIAAKSSSTTTFRRMNEEDVADIVRIYVREYGPSNPERTFTLFPPFCATMPITQFCDNFVLACILYLALYQRLKGTWITESDHQVWVLSNCEEEDVIGVAELSMEAPGRTALPIALPVGIKKRLFGTKVLQPYISNVIVKKSYRNGGYGTVLLQKLEQVAQQEHAPQQLTLHVSANAVPAQSLYRKLGYTVVESKRKDLLGRLVRYTLGFYFLPEGELLYMKKVLS